MNLVAYGLGWPVATSVRPVEPSAYAVVAAGLSVFALVVVVVLAIRVGRLIRVYDALVSGDEQAGFVDVVGRRTDELRTLRAEVQQLREELDRTRGAAAS